MGESGVDLLSHTVKCNIIGAVSFHGPVRDGKGWDQDAMGTRLEGGALGWAVRPGVSAHDSGEVRVVGGDCGVFGCCFIDKELGCFFELNVIGSSLTGN